MNATKKRRLHRIRPGHDCPHCGMHFGWQKQFLAHTATCQPQPKKTAVAIGLRYSR